MTHRNDYIENSPILPILFFILFLELVFCAGRKIYKSFIRKNGNEDDDLNQEQERQETQRRNSLSDHDIKYKYNEDFMKDPRFTLTSMSIEGAGPAGVWPNIYLPNEICACKNATNTKARSVLVGHGSARRREQQARLYKRSYYGHRAPKSIRRSSRKSNLYQIQKRRSMNKNKSKLVGKVDSKDKVSDFGRRITKSF